MLLRIKSFLRLFITIVGSQFIATPLLYGADITFYDFSANDIDGKLVKMSSYEGKVILVVNTASKCGFTSQYAGLEELYLEFAPKGFVVLGFPSNDFMGQEPGTNAEIKSFCTEKFAVTFPLFEKNPVSGKERQEIFKFLTQSGDNDTRGDVKWNFEKFLINRKGKVVGRFGSFTPPSSTDLREMIVALLAEPAVNENLAQSAAQ